MVGTLPRCGLLLAAWHSRGLQRRHIAGAVREPRLHPVRFGCPEAGFEKLTIYGEQDEWEHATRQVDHSGWTSKLDASLVWGTAQFVGNDRRGFASVAWRHM